MSNMNTPPLKHRCVNIVCQQLCGLLCQTTIHALIKPDTLKTQDLLQILDMEGSEPGGIGLPLLVSRVLQTNPRAHSTREPNEVKTAERQSRAHVVCLLLLPRQARQVEPR